MEKMSSYVDMALTPDDKAEKAIPSPIDYLPNYPYGLCLSMDDKTLEKLGAKVTDFAVGEVISFDAMGKVTAVSQNDTGNGPCGRVEVQITGIAVDNDDEPKPYRPKNPYAEK